MNKMQLQNAASKYENLRMAVCITTDIGITQGHSEPVKISLRFHINFIANV